MRKISKREKWLVAGAVVSMLVSAYILFRVQPEQLNLAVFDERIAQLNEDLSKARVPKALNKNAADIKVSIQKNKVMLEKQKMRLGFLEEDLVDAASAEALQHLVLEISRLAKDSGVLIQETEAFMATKKDIGPNLDKSLINKLLLNEGGRPARSIVIEGGFDSIKSFIKGLGGLSKKVVVLKLAINLRSNVFETNYNPQAAQQLTAALVVAF